MIMPKLLLLLVPFIFLVVPRNISHRGLVLTKVPIKKSDTGTKISHVSNENATITSNNNNVSNIVVPENNSISVNYVNFTESAQVNDVTLKKKSEFVPKKYDVTIVYPENYIISSNTVIFPFNEELPNITNSTPMDIHLNKSDESTKTREALSTTNNPIIEKNSAPTDLPAFSLYEQSQSDIPESLTRQPDRIKIDVSEKMLPEVIMEPIPTQPDINLKPSVRRPFVFRENLKKYLIRRNQASDYSPNLNEQTKPTIPMELYVNTQRPTWYLTGRPSYADFTTTSSPTTAYKQIKRPVVQRKLRPFYNVRQLHNFICKTVNGYYSNSNGCNEYVECKNNKAYQKKCPDGLHFNPATLWPAFPCSYPSEVECPKLFISEQKQYSDKCPRSYGFFPAPEGDCGRFIMCQDGSAITMSCPPGLAFNSIKSNCDWPINVPGCNPTIFQDFICPEMPLDKFEDPSRIIYNYRYKSSCKKYISCQEGSPRLLSCDTGLSFDENTQKCVNSNFITNCNN